MRCHESAPPLDLPVTFSRFFRTRPHGALQPLPDHGQHDDSNDRNACARPSTNPAWFPHERGHVQDVFQPIVRAFRSFIAPRWELPHHPTQPATAHSPKHSAITRSLDFCDIGTLQVSPERASSSVAGSALTALARHLVLLPLHVPIRSFRGCGASGRAPIGLLRSGHASLSKGRGCRSRTSSPPR